MVGPVATCPSMSQPTVDVLIFTAERCAPCRAMKPLLAALADEYAGRARFVTVDADADPTTAQRYDARSIPTLVLVRDGRQVGRVIGARPRKIVVEALENALA